MPGGDVSVILRLPRQGFRATVATVSFLGATTAVRFDLAMGEVKTLLPDQEAAGIELG
ncbi:hypothetical protein ROBYS_30240 [Roseobacter sp. OBYS 0001]|nr:hypothetical protein ROBYS_30240 [Roseobacter sp. OBYS 0001]